VPPRARHDFNADGRSDILWRDSSSGNNMMYLMNRAAIILNAALPNLPPNWSIVGQWDFDGDGKADILWRDTSGNRGPRCGS
jgi:hypothetical protein